MYNSLMIGESCATNIYVLVGKPFKSCPTHIFKDTDTGSYDRIKFIKSTVDLVKLVVILQAIARRLLELKQTAPHLYLSSSLRNPNIFLAVI